MTPGCRRAGRRALLVTGPTLDDFIARFPSRLTLRARQLVGGLNRHSLFWRRF